MQYLSTYIYEPIETAFAIFSVFPFRSGSRGWIGRQPQKKTNTGILSSFDLLAVRMRSMTRAASQHCPHAIMHGEPEPWHKWITKFMLCQRKNTLDVGIWPCRSRLLWLLCASLAACFRYVAWFGICKGKHVRRTRAQIGRAVSSWTHEMAVNNNVKQKIQARSSRICSVCA